MFDTTLSRRKAVQLGAATGLALLPGRRLVSAQEKTITYWNISGIYEVEDPNDKTKKPEDFYVYQAIARFEAANPGLKVQMEALPGDTSSFTKYRAASVAANGPDIMTMWSGSYMLAMKDFLELLTPFFTVEERSRILGWEATSADFKVDSQEVYGVPASSDGTSCIFYNKELLDKAGIDPDGDWRASLDGFVGALEAIKASGTTPIAFDQNAIIWQLLAWWWAQELGGASVVGELVSGQRNFSDAPMPDIVAGWQKLNAYALPGAQSTDGDTSFRLMLPGDVAMTTAGFWAIAPLRDGLGDKLGMVKMPNFSPDAPIQDGGIGGIGNAFMVSNYSAVKDEAVAFIKFLMSKEEQELKAKSGQGRLINVTDVDTAELYSDPLTNTQQQWANEPSTVFWLDNLFPADLTTEIKAQSQLAWTSEISADEFLAKIDAKRDGSWAASVASTQMEPATAQGALEAGVARQHAARRRGGLTLQRRESLIAYVSLIPAFLLVAAVIWYPVTRTLYHGFTDWNGAKSTWIGWENYEKIFTNGELWLLMRNNLIFVAAVPGILLISLVVTVLLFEEVPGWRFFRSVYYLPTILSAAVVGTLMRVMFQAQGAANDILGRIGLEQFQHDWLGSVSTAFMVLIFAFYWQTLGQGVLIFLAGLATISSDLLEAARLDGAGWWNRLTRIIIPLLVPTIAYFVLTNVIWIFVGLFGLVFTVTKGGPGYATTPFDLMIYRKAFESGDMGYASALSVILFIIVLAISAVQLRTFDRLTTDV